MPTTQVLIADDSETIRRAIRILLSDAKFVATEVASFTELAEALASTKPNVVLMDLHMPGVEQADKVKEHMDGTCLLAMSLYDDLESQTLAARFGAVRLLDKGTLGSTLLDAIHDCLNNSRKASA